LRLCVCLSVCLSVWLADSLTVDTPAVAIFIRFWRNLAHRL